MESFRTRLRVVEVSPRLDYLSDVIREIRNLHMRRHNQDPFIARHVIPGLQFRLTWEEPGRACFRYAVEGNRHHKGDEYSVSFHGGLCHVSTIDRNVAPVTIDAASPDSLCAESLQKALELLAVKCTLEL